jgi:hypothetical protein
VGGTSPKAREIGVGDECGAVIGTETAIVPLGVDPVLGFPV